MPYGKGTYGSKVGRPPKKKEEVKPKRARQMPMTDKQAKAAKAALKKDASKKKKK
jgi:hypothetical protein